MTRLESRLVNIQISVLPLCSKLRILVFLTVFLHRRCWPLPAGLSFGNPAIKWVIAEVTLKGVGQAFSEPPRVSKTRQLLSPRVAKAQPGLEFANTFGVEFS